MASLPRKAGRIETEKQEREEKKKENRGRRQEVAAKKTNRIKKKIETRYGMETGERIERKLV